MVQQAIPVRYWRARDRFSVQDTQGGGVLDDRSNCKAVLSGDSSAETGQMRRSNLPYRLAATRSREHPRMKKALFFRAVGWSARICDALRWALQEPNYSLRRQRMWTIGRCALHNFCSWSRHGRIWTLKPELGFYP